MLANEVIKEGFWSDLGKSALGGITDVARTAIGKEINRAPTDPRVINAIATTGVAEFFKAMKVAGVATPADQQKYLKQWTLEYMTGGQSIKSAQLIAGLIDSVPVPTNASKTMVFDYLRKTAAKRGEALNKANLPTLPSAPKLTDTVPSNEQWSFMHPDWGGEGVHAIITNTGYWIDKLPLSKVGIRIAKDPETGYYPVKDPANIQKIAAGYEAAKAAGGVTVSPIDTL